MYMWHTLSIDDVRKKLRTSLEKGLTDEEAQARREKYGKNELVEKNKTSFFFKFLNQFKDFMIIILIFAAIISAGLAFVEGTNEYVDSIIIITIVVLNAIMGVVQESKAEKSLEALKKMSAPTCKVKRDGEIKQIESSMLVPGDIVILETGSYVPADIRLIKTYNLKTEESALTRRNNIYRKKCRCITKRKFSNWRYAKYGICNNNSSWWTWRRNCSKYWNEYKCRKNCKYDNSR